MKKLLLLLYSLLLCSVGIAETLPYQDPSLPIDKRVEDLMSRMTIEEKADYISGMKNCDIPGEQWDGTKGNERLGIVPIRIYHGPYGVGCWKYVNKNGVYYPSSINMATTWNPELVEQLTTSLSKELKASGGQSSAGPAMNIIRDLRGGRSMEYFTEDPYLNGEIAAAYVRGVQSQHNIAIMKHYACNNKEDNRFFLNANVSERAIREIYLPGFKAAVERGGAMGVMTGYNRVNGVHNSAHKHLNNDILKEEWGFKGIVMTDWVGSDRSTTNMVNSGLDLEMPAPLRYRKSMILSLLDKGEITQEQIDEKVRRILYTTFWCGIMDEKPTPKPELIATKECVEIARKAAEESLVLLKNDGDILPLDREKVKRVAVIGPNGEWGDHFRNGQKTYQMLQGGGSATIAPSAKDMITPYAGVKSAAKGVEVLFEAGCYGEHGFTVIEPQFFTTNGSDSGLDAKYFGNNEFSGDAALKVDKNVHYTWYKVPDIIEEGNTQQGNPKRKFSIEWSGKLHAPESRTYNFETRVVGAMELYIDDKLVLTHSAGTAIAMYEVCSIKLDSGYHDIKVKYSATDGRNELSLLWDYGAEEYLRKAIELAKTADAVIMPVGTSGAIETEAGDRDVMLDNTDYISLSKSQERLIKEISKVNKNVIVVTYTAGVVCEEWKSDVASIIYAGFPGQEGGTALGRIIFGDVNPSGKLSVTIPKSSSQFPESWHNITTEITYDEGIYVGYRYFDKHKLEPSFAFGSGLSYTDFSYGKMKISRSTNGGKPTVKVSIPITNIGSRSGKEVVQLYVNDAKCSVDRPSKELKAFKKIELSADQTTTVEFELDADAFSFFSEKSGRWVLEPGKFNIYIGSASDDIRSTGVVAL